MARTKIDFVVPDYIGRDAGKRFTITEMPAMQAEKWAIRALLAVAKGGADIDFDSAQKGMAGFAEIGLKAFANVRFEDAEPLLNEMLKCVKYVPSQNVERAIMEDDADIEEIMTYVLLRKTAVELHIAPFLNAAKLISE